MSAFEKVAAGVALLDEIGPERWRDQVDARWFEIRSSSSCVLGQLFGDYTTAVIELSGILSEDSDAVERRDEWASDHGFFVKFDDEMADEERDDEGDSWDDLEAAWLAVLAPTGE